MRRILGLLIGFLLLSGCAALNSGQWDQIQVSFRSGGSGGTSYTLTVTPTKATYTSGTDKQVHALPEGAWTALVAGIGSLGARSVTPCPDGQYLQIQAKADGTVLQTFQTSSCDAGDTLAQAQQVVEQILRLVR